MTDIPTRTPWSTDPVLELDHVSCTYAGTDSPQLSDVTLTVEEGEILLVVGRTGSGKSTLLGAMTGAMPHATGGLLTGHVRVLGRDTRDFPPRLLADAIGVVGQNPAESFVADTVEEELAYAMEQAGLPEAVMAKRVEETLDLLGIGELRHALVTELSGGQQQRVAIGAVLTTRPAVVVLDEPTSALDPTGAEDVLATITKLAHDVGMAVIIAEHRIERVLSYVDRIAHVNADGTVTVGSPAGIMADSDVYPPLIELGRWAGWAPLPLSIRAARKAAAPLRERLFTAASASAATTGTLGTASPDSSQTARDTATPEPLLSARSVVVEYPGVRAVDGVDLDLHPGEITVLMGRNGCGKSTFLWAVQGTGTRTSGSIQVTAGGNPPVDPAALKPSVRMGHISLVPQNPTDILYESTVGRELAAVGRALATAQHENASGEPGQPGPSPRAILDQLAPGIPDDIHPRDLSEGQKLALALAVQLAAQPPVNLFDEPTRGLDYGGKRALVAMLTDLKAAGHAILVVTHDVEFAALAADTVHIMADGMIVASGTARDMLAASPAYAPQVAKITAGVQDPSHWLTVEEVIARA
ncbi:MAG: ATP-binding cassette domain-containing protein [Corynebacterium sp.]|nr:ATP-binding cassette domain-containing protein [Corynebacterium sp.]